MDALPDVFWLTRRLADVPRHNDWLGPGERVALSGMRILKRRADWRLGRWTAKCAIQEFLAPGLDLRSLAEVEILAGPDGGPRVFLRGAPAPFTLSLAHSRGVALCAVSRLEGDVGCDIEWIEPRSEAFVSDFFSPAERESVAKAAPGERDLVATVLWSAKESALKVLRVGLRRDTRTVVVDTRFERRQEDPIPFEARCTDTRDHFGGRWWRSGRSHVCSLAWRRAPGRAV